MKRCPECNDYLMVRGRYIVCENEKCLYQADSGFRTARQNAHKTKTPIRSIPKSKKEINGR